jgi:hypothetical protein
MQKIKKAGYCNQMYSLEEGINDYVTNFLSGKKYY